MLVNLFYEVKLLKYYNVYEHSGLGAVKAIKEGLSWPAFFFTWIWALYKKCYLCAVVIIMMMIVLAALHIPSFLVLAIVFIHCFMMVRAEEMQIKASKVMGYQWRARVAASNVREALSHCKLSNRLDC